VAPSTAGEETLDDPPSPAAERSDLPAAIGPYPVSGRVGHGAFGVVYKGYDPALGRNVAVKVLRPEALRSSKARERFLREAKAVARLLHGNIVPVHQFGPDGDGYFIASAFIEGQALSELIPPDGMEPARAVRLVIQLLDALSYAHGEGVLHRDVKPSNLLLGAEDRLYLTDFGMAMIAGEDGARLTGEGAVLGTLAYMAPEQARGELAHVGPAADQYSAGVVLYELLTGHVPFEGAGNNAALLYQVVNAAPPKPSEYQHDLAPRLEAICLKAMAKNIDDRFTGCHAFAVALREWLRETEIPATVAPQPPEGRAPTGRLRARVFGALVAVGLTALLAAGLAVGLALLNRPRPEGTGLAGPPVATGAEENKTADDAELTTDKVYERLLKSVVWIMANPGEKDSWSGNGALVDRPERLVVTPEFVCDKRCRTIAGLFPAYSKGELIQDTGYYTGRIATAPRAKLVFSDERRGLSLIQFETIPDDAAALKLAREGARPGQPVFSLGGGGKGSLGQWSFSQGVVQQSAFQSGRTAGGIGTEGQVIECQLPTAPGDAGKPVVDSRCALVGLHVSAHKDRPASSVSIDVSEIRALLSAYSQAAGKAPDDSGRGN
jgi:tRNA A-37 threonylcarbamoyl transferase component Bud32